MGRPKTQNNGQIVKRESAPGNDLRSMIRRMGPQLAMALPKHIDGERLTRIAMTAVTANPKLADCDPGSFMGCLLTAAQLGLEPNTPLGQGYLIPRGRTCTWQTGYQGYIDLAYRSGMVTGIDAEVVRQGDHFVWRKGLEPKLEHEPSLDADREQQPITHVYGVVRIRNADPHFQVLSYAQVEKRRLMNEAEKRGKFSPWREHYAEMAKKTAIKAALKYAPKSAEMQRVEALEDVGEHGGRLDVVVDDRVAEALASQGLSITDIVDPDSGPGSDPGSGNGRDSSLIDAMAQAADVSPEQAKQMLDQGWELDPNGNEPIPPPPPEASA